MDNNWSNEFRNSLQLVPARNSLRVQLNQSRLPVSQNHQRRDKHRQFSPFSSQKILDPRRNFLISHAPHKSDSLKIFQDIAKSLRAYSWELLSQVAKAKRSFISKLS